MQRVARWPTLSWLESASSGSNRRRVVYRGSLSGPPLQLHYGFDGWREPLRDADFEFIERGVAVAEVSGAAGHVSLECAITDGREWDNNSGLDYRLWLDFDALDSHLHVSGRGSGQLGLRSFLTAADSAGIRGGVVSWPDHRLLDRLALREAGLWPLVWVRPGETKRSELRLRLASGFVGIKLHPTSDDYHADDPALDPYIDIAAEMGVPVACHSAPGDADPDHIRRLAERFPTVPLILYHTYLGPREGRVRAVRHALEQPNLLLETSWCGWRDVMAFVDQVGADRVLFGSDAVADGHAHYLRDPPNVEGQETYNGGLVALVRSLGTVDARKVMSDNTRRVFALDAEAATNGLSETRSRRAG
jgi:Amidohydrolase/Starch/carbohydrate-binding module (family 53)